MTLEEILQDIHGLDARLRELEQQYGLLSEDLYTLYRLGELEQSRGLSAGSATMSCGRNGSARMSRSILEGK